jgi:hypothetical protein
MCINQFSPAASQSVNIIIFYINLERGGVQRLVFARILLSDVQLHIVCNGNKMCAILLKYSAIKSS